MNRRDFLRSGAATAGYLTLASTIGCATTPTPRDESVIVIGAGIAGITVAQSLRESGYQVQVLEAQSRNGGRIMTNRAFGIPVDLGAAWIHGKRRNPITKLANRYGTGYAETDWSNLQGYAKGAAVSRGELRKIHPELSAIYRKTYWKEATEHLDDMIDEITKDAGRRSNLSSDSISDPDDVLSGSELRQVSELRRASLQVDSEYHEYGGGEQLVVGGYDTIVQGLSEGLPIQNRQVVEKIVYTSNGVSVVTNQGAFSADRVVITVPLGVLKSRSIEFDPGLSVEREGALDRMGMTTLNKVVLRFPKAFWPKDADGLVQVNQSGSPRLFLNLHHHFEEPVLVYLAASTHGRELENLEDKDAVGYATDILKDMYGSNIPDATTGLRTRWASNPFSLGSFSYRKAGSTPSDRDLLAKPMDNRIFFAGEATHATRYGTVHGAYLSGLRVAEEVLNA